MMTTKQGRPVLETRLHPLNLALSGGLVMGVTLFFTTIISSSTGYGMAFLELLSSIYPGYGVSVPGAFIGLVYAFIDAFVGLFVIAWLYNYFEIRRQRRAVRNELHVAT